MYIHKQVFMDAHTYLRMSAYAYICLHTHHVRVYISPRRVLLYITG